jgi:hypothetical protein
VLILQPVFLRQYLGVEKEPLAIFLDEWAIASIGMFSLPIVIGIAFHYGSAKWIKQAWGERTWLSTQGLECWLDGLFWMQAGSFLGGIAFFLVIVIKG